MIELKIYLRNELEIYISNDYFQIKNRSEADDKLRPSFSYSLTHTNWVI